jgi:hypothetical protein
MVRHPLRLRCCDLLPGVVGLVIPRCRLTVVHCRIGVGVSENGMMAGPASALSNAVICNPANGTFVQQYRFMNASFAGIVADVTTGTTDMICWQANGLTGMSWSRWVNNGNPTDAQVSATGPTNVMWAIGKSNGMTCRFGFDNVGQYMERVIVSDVRCRFESNQSRHGSSSCNSSSIQQYCHADAWLCTELERGWVAAGLPGGVLGCCVVGEVGRVCERERV